LTADVTQLVRVADDPQSNDDAAFDRTDVDQVDVAGDLVIEKDGKFSTRLPPERAQSRFSGSALMAR